MARKFEWLAEVWRSQFHMNYYFLTPGPSSYTSGDISFTPPIENYAKFGSGLQTLSADSCSLDIRKSSRILQSDWFSVNLGWVGSEVFRDVFDEGDVNAVKIDSIASRTINPEVKKNYYFYEVARQVDCFDLQKSKYSRSRGLVRVCSKCVLDLDKVAGRNYFFVDGICNFNLVVSEHFVNRISAKLKGVDLVNVDDAQWRV